MKYLILGAGIAGISAGYHLAKKNEFDFTIFEANNSWGGLCDNFNLDNGFRFDYFVHLSFTKNKYVQKLFSKSTQFIKHKPSAYNYTNGYWLKHPVQNNLFPLSTDEKVKIIADFVNKPVNKKIKNYDDWLISQFGKYFTDNYPGKYTKKYWTTDPKNLTIDWLGKRFSIPSFEGILKGSFEEQEENFYYANEMRYPTQGGYKSFLKSLVEKCNIKLNKRAILIDNKKKKVIFSDGTYEHYDYLISSIPIPELIWILKDAPKSIRESANKLIATSGQLVSLGFNRPDIAKFLWFYIYDKDILPSRAYSPSIKSPDNVPKGKSSLQFETYFSKYNPRKFNNDNLVEHVIKKGNDMNLWKLNDIEVTDCREVKYANVVFDFNRKPNLKRVHNYLDRINIKYIGRFGEWDYLWSDQSLLSGMKVLEIEK